MKRYRMTFVLAMLLMFAACASLYAMAYRANKLITPVGATSTAHAANESGQVVGELDYARAVTAVVWDKSGVLSTPLTEDSWAFDINHSGEVLGTFRGGDGYSHPYVWRPGIGVTDLFPVLGGRLSADAINDDGCIAGTDETAWPQMKAFVLDAASNIQYVPTDDADRSWAVGISESGTVAGTVAVNGVSSHPFLWNPRSGLSIMFPDVQNTGAIAISSSGVLLASTSRPDHSSELFIWSEQFGKRTLGISTDQNTIGACAVNDSGMVTGVLASPGGPEKAFVWSPDTGFTVLGEGHPYDINNAGWIVGQMGWDMNGQAVLWEPVPEPSTLLTLGMGILPLAGVVIRRRRYSR